MQIPADFLQNAHRSCREIAEIFGISATTIRKWKRELGVAIHPPGGEWRRGRKSTVVPSDFVEMSEDNIISDLAAHYGVSTSTISQWRAISGLTQKQGDLQSFRKKYAAIIADGRSTMPTEAIAAKHNQSRSWVSQVLIKAGEPRDTNAVLRAELKKAATEIKRLRDEIGALRPMAGTKGRG